MGLVRKLLYGEDTVLMRSRRIPLSKKDEIEGRVDLILSEYVHPVYKGVVDVSKKKKR